jgi:N-glycosylase/DNA lyase
LEIGTEEDIFKELVFCLLTPQSKAKICWIAVENLAKQDLVLNGDIDAIAHGLKCVRFRFNKAKYILEARRKFMNRNKIDIKQKIGRFKNIIEARDWLVKNVKGLGYKESSHFLRNIGLGEDIAILDRHILKNLKLIGVIEEIPNSLSKTKYLEIEQGFRRLAYKLNIPVSHLDLVLWYKETRELFK